MKYARVCGHNLYVPDSVADWDAVAEDSPWEKPRMDSILSTLQPGDVFWEVGAEHGWMAAIYAMHVGGENTVLIEPSPEFWPNIWGCWHMNGLREPIATIEAFASDVNQGKLTEIWPWPQSIKGTEVAGLAYRKIGEHDREIPSRTIDQLVIDTGRPPKGISIDVEGAELRVIKGMEWTLRHDRPWVWLSVHPDLMERDFGNTPEQIWAVIDDADYDRKLLGIDHEEHWLLYTKGWL